MKIRNIIINITPLIIWIVYFKLTVTPEKIYFIMPIEELVLTIFMPIIYGLYNSFSEKKKMIIGDIIFFLSQSIGCYIGGKIYLSSNFRGSDYPYAVKTITKEVIITCGIMLVVCIVIRLGVNKIRNKYVQ